MLSKIIIISVTFLIIIILLVLLTNNKNQRHEYFSDQPTTVKVKLQINGYWQISHNDKILKNGANTGANTTDLSVLGVKFYDTIKIRVINVDKKGGIIGYLEENGKKYVTNTENFKISGQYVGGEGKGLGTYSGGRYLGCFTDRLDSGTSYGGNNGTVSCQTYCQNKDGIWPTPKGSDCVSATINGKVDYDVCHKIQGYNKGLTSCQCKLGETEPRALPNYQENAKTISECHQAAVNAQQLYYGLQSGNECWIGSGYNKYGSLQPTKCGMRCDSNQQQYCGGPLANQVYSTFDPAEILSLTDKEVKARAKDVPHNAWWIFPKQGDLPATWPDGIWEYVWTYLPPDKIPFCNYPKYLEYQPSGCQDATNEYTCWKTEKPNYQVDTQRCKTIYQPNTPLGTDESFQILNRAYRKATEHPEGIDGGLLEQYLQTMSDTFNAACRVIKDYAEPSYYHGLCQTVKKQQRQNLEQACFNMPENQREVAIDVNQDLQDCEPGSVECQQLKEECHNRGHCFNNQSENGPRCYLPPTLTKYEGLNTPNFYSSLAKASELVTFPAHKKSTTSAKFNELSTNLMELARKAEFNSSDKKDCNCQNKLTDPTGLSCYPC